MNEEFKLTEMRFRDPEGREIIIHLDERGETVWSGQFDRHGAPVPPERLSKPLGLRILIAGGKTPLAGAMCCRQDPSGRWICRPGPC